MESLNHFSYLDSMYNPQKQHVAYLHSTQLARDLYNTLHS